MAWPSLLRRWEPVRWPETVVSVDLETSGLDVQGDQILSLAAVRVRGCRIELHDRFDVRLLSDAAVKPEAIRHHRLRPQDLHGAADPQAAVQAFLSWLGDDPLIGYALAFDLSFLRRYAKQAERRFAPRNADVRERYAARIARRHPHSHPDLRFEAICAALGVSPVGRHEALGDAVTTALMWIALGHGEPRAG